MPFWIPRRSLALQRASVNRISARRRGRPTHHWWALGQDRPRCRSRPEEQCILTWRISFASLESHLPKKGNPPRVRNSRRWYNLLKERLRYRNRVKGLLAGQGIYDFEPLGTDLMRDLAETAHE